MFNIILLLSMLCIVFISLYLRTRKQKVAIKKEYDGLFLKIPGMRIWFRGNGWDKGFNGEKIEDVKMLGNHCSYSLTFKIDGKEYIYSGEREPFIYVPSNLAASTIVK